MLGRSLRITGHTARACSSRRGLASAAAGVDFRLSNDQKALQQLARTFAREEVMPKSAHHDKTGEYPQELFRKAWELGLVNAHIPEAYGGGGLGNLEGIVLAEELSYADAGVMTAIEINTVAALPVILAGSEAQKREYLGRLTAAPTQAAYAVTEPGTGSDVAAIKTRAEKKGDEWIVNGAKMWITNGGVANWYFLLARTGAPGTPAGSAFTAFIVDRNTPGLTVGVKEDMLGQRASDTRGITFEDVRVPAANVLGREGDGFKLAMRVFDYTRPPVAAGAVGIARRATDEAIAYALQRRSMGVPIAQHQAVAFKIADMATGVEAARLLTYKVSGGRGRPDSAGWCDQARKVL